MATVETAKDDQAIKAGDQDVEAKKEEESAGAPAEGESTKEAETDAQDQEFDVVRESTGSQPKPAENLGVRKRINKLNAKFESAKHGEEQANSDLALEREKVKILQLALDQQKEAQPQSAIPNPDDFDSGVYDPGYVKKYQEYQDATLKQEVRRQVDEATKQTVQTHTQTAQTQNLERKQIKHYERAKEIGAKDYGDVEDKAIAVLGNDVVNHLIANFDDSHVLLYYLGKNPGEAARIADRIQSNPIQGIAEIGALRSELKIKPKSNNTPDPDEELEGGSPGGNFDANEKKLEKLREEAKKTGNMKKLMAFKKKLKEQVKT